MVKTLLGLSELPAEDAADALAVAICHAQSTKGIQINPPKQI
jgi:Holliday junction resolvasome RuvABC endonuclease subunit